MTAMQHTYIKLDPEDPAVIEKYMLGENDEKNQGRTVQKIKNNIWSAHRCIELQYASMHMAMAMYLDGANGRTSIIFRDSGINTDNLIPVNNNSNIAKYLAKIAPNAICANFADALDMIAPEMKSRISLVWYDGCATLMGSKDGFHPYGDISKCLRVLPQDIILAVTFCNRARHPRTLETAKRIGCSLSELSAEDQDDDSDASVTELEEDTISDIDDTDGVTLEIEQCKTTTYTATSTYTKITTKSCTRVSTRGRKRKIKQGIKMHVQIKGLKRLISKNGRKFCRLADTKTLTYKNMTFWAKWTHKIV